MRTQVRDHIRLVILCLMLVGCRKKVAVSENIAKLLESGASQVDMSTTTDFVWDHMFVFGPYSGKRGICITLKLAEPQCSKEGIRDVDENESLMVFLHGAAVTRVESLPRVVGNFDDNCLDKDLKRVETVLFVDRRPQVYLVCH